MESRKCSETNIFLKDMDESIGFMFCSGQDLKCISSEDLEITIDFIVLPISGTWNGSKFFFL